ncbi:MAG: dienelactone hydrolase family protein [Tannerella sp.]|nr:dienelactone hydrolase family protein [Tannerella sp.]
MMHLNSKFGKQTLPVIIKCRFFDNLKMVRNKIAYCIPLCLLLANSVLCAQASKPDYSLFEKNIYTNGKQKLRYRILWPETMEEGEKYPLFIFLHGMGLGGKDNKKQLKRGAELFLTPENRTKYPCIVLYPQAPLGKSFVKITKNGRPLLFRGFRKFTKEKPDSEKLEMSLSPYGKMVHEVISQLITENVVDTSRIYIGGASMGAFCTFQLISEYPIFAAAASMAGGADPTTLDNWAGKVPVWIVHGNKDPIVPVESSRAVVKQLEERGITNYRYNEYGNLKHHCWDKAFVEPDYLEWFFSKCRE